MPATDQPAQPPLDPHREVDSEDEHEEDASDEGSEDEESSVDGFDVREGEEIEDYMTETLIGQRDSEDLEAEHAALKLQWAEVLKEDQMAKAALEEAREAVKRKLEEREELIKLKRLRMSVQLAMEAMDEAC